jgi:hydroxymethylbilane synthase
VGRDLDAVVLARAGLVRLGREGEASEVLDPSVMLPAPGQGALAVECRTPQTETDHELVSLLAALDHGPTRAAAIAERVVLAALEAGCAAPVGALAVTSADTTLHLEAVLAAIDGARVLRRRASGPAEDPEGLGLGLAAELLAAGAVDLLAARRSADGRSSVAVPTAGAPSARPASSRPATSRPASSRPATSREGAAP